MKAWQRVTKDTRPGWEDPWLVSHLHDQHGWEVSRQLETGEKRFLQPVTKITSSYSNGNSADHSKTLVVPGASESPFIPQGLPWLLGPPSLSVSFDPSPPHPPPRAQQDRGAHRTVHSHVFVR